MYSPLFLGNVGPSEIFIILIIVLVFFGGKKIPELMKGIGQGIREFNNAKANIEAEVKDNLREIEKK
jgi:sec-independent protein translocase protein TatA